MKKNADTFKQIGSETELPESRFFNVTMIDVDGGYTYFQVFDSQQEASDRIRETINEGEDERNKWTKKTAHVFIKAGDSVYHLSI